ncbi:MAG: GTPase Era [Mucilaginibacter sp.]|uniref:GTPase Era n=1 Tax=Mucilaginibacter sp. L3T2-6 TaxID=3062491 RepID=UPI002676D9D6|nr:GTPase Era [Mucilaginibacter sp. L3T2-6]MDO3644225.1 GTPase Era [Mucilaginibacter sp. L3T2-6]MDV6216678.1 GTPase Era [Mucilaginibacter sp. L3T2-6]
MAHKAGFVSIIGKPNAGKSTLMNALVGENMSIITPKAQTTRHRILGIVNDTDYQIVFSDTPGVIKPHYALHESMMHQVDGSIVDADLILLVTDIYEEFDETDVLKKLEGSLAPIAVLVNKVDQSDEETVKAKLAFWEEKLRPKAIFAISALKNYNIQAVMNFVVDNLPEHPAYYEKDALTDRNDRFFASEMIRAQILKQYKKEIPYSVEVVVTSFVEGEKLYRISAEIIVERDSQKNIIIGKGGEMLKIVGTYARRDMEDFFQRKIFLEMFVKVIPDWRSKKNYLKKFGYE